VAVKHQVNAVTGEDGFEVFAHYEVAAVLRGAIGGSVEEH
jgi:hypothetical protein